MKIKIIEDPSCDYDLLVTVKSLTPEIEKVLDQLNDLKITVEHRGETLLLSIHDVLFFETEGEYVYAHQEVHSYRTKYRLYELEDVLPNAFVRISKSTIVNSHAIASLERKITSTRQITFFESNKIIYVSRMYYPVLKTMLQERSSIL